MDVVEEATRSPTLSCQVNGLVAGIVTKIQEPKFIFIAHLLHAAVFFSGLLIDWCKLRLLTWHPPRVELVACFIYTGTKTKTTICTREILIERG